MTEASASVGLLLLQLLPSPQFCFTTVSLFGYLILVRQCFTTFSSTLKLITNTVLYSVFSTLSLVFANVVKHVLSCLIQEYFFNLKVCCIKEEPYFRAPLIHAFTGHCCNIYKCYCNYSFQNWSVQYNKSEPVAPRYEINAPDLYIPGMVSL